MPYINQAREHMEYHHGDADGWIAIAQRKGSAFVQRHYRPEEAGAALTEWIGEDVYFSQNTFYRCFRRVENVRQLRAIYVDVDHYLLNLSPDWVIGNMEMHLFGQSVPDPNLIIHSGRGFAVVWFIESVPGKTALPLWQAVERYFAAQFKTIGGDPKATDAARVFRIAGSINSKNGAEVSVQYRHQHRYELRQLQADYLPELTPKKAKGRPAKVAHLYKIHRLYHARLLDLTKLLEMRSYNVTGYRETICFLYRYWSCCYLDDADEALRQTLELNSEFSQPLSDREVIRATQSATKAYKAKNDREANRIAQERGYPGAGYNIGNEKLIEWLRITPEEQRHLQTIIDKNEKRRRNTQAKRDSRRASGMATRSDYLADQANITADRLWLLRKAVETHPNATQVELARLLGVSERYIRKLIQFV